MAAIYPASYRQEFFQRLSKLILRGESVLLMGPPGIGKSSQLQLLLTDPKIRQVHFPNTTFHTFWFDAEDSSSENQTASFRALSSIRQSSKPHTFIIVDHPDYLLSSSANSITAAIRSVRDVTRPRTAVITLSNLNLTKIKNFGSLTPILSSILENPIMVPPLDPTDSQLAINFQLSYYEARLTKSDQAKIISVCCGIPRLIKRLVKLAADSVNLQSVIDNPAQDPKLKLDLERIAEFNRANPENVYSTPMLDHLEELTNSDYEQIGPVRFPAHLSRQEYDLAEFLIDHKEEFVSREQMIEAIWKNRMYDINEHALDQMLHRLRHKLATASPKSDLITYRGRGCKLKVS